MCRKNPLKNFFLKSIEMDDTTVSFSSPSMYDPGSQGHTQHKRSGYKDYNYQRRAIQSSPNQIIDDTYGSPSYSISSSKSGSVRNTISPGGPIDTSSFKTSPGSMIDPDFVLKNPIFLQESPRRVPVVMPGGIEYEMPDEKEITVNNISPYPPHNSTPHIPQNHHTSTPHSSDTSNRTPHTYHSHPHHPHSIYHSPPPHHTHTSTYQASAPHTSAAVQQQYYHPPHHISTAYPSTYHSPPPLHYSDHHNSTYQSAAAQHQYYQHPPHNSTYQSSAHHPSAPHNSTYQSAAATPQNSNPYDEILKRLEEERKEDKKLMHAMLETMNEMREEKIREKEAKMREAEEKETRGKKQPGQRTPSSPGFTVPESEPVLPKSKIPDYESMDDIEKENFKEKFRNNYNLLTKRYPRWLIEIPDFNVLPLATIHERYENVVRAICIYQTAMKWKVYLVVIIAGIEYYVGYKQNQAWCRGLLESQIKTIHKFDSYLIEFATMFYTDEQGEDYPLWMRFLGTFASGLATFSTINGAANAFGKCAPENLLHEADKFVSPTEGTAKLRSDGISDVPEVPEVNTLQDPNSAINGIGWIFDMCKGFFSSNTTTTPAATATAQAVPATPQVQTKNIDAKDLDDLDDADL